jgi:membrane protein implicated in regulation of membrane protease activity
MGDILMSQPVFWWFLSATAVVVEILTGTFYLLMVATGFAAGAITAHLGFSFTVQMMSVSLVAVGATLTWHEIRSRHPSLRAGRDRNVELDVGETVQVATWDSNHTCRVQYRGTLWTAELDAQSVDNSDIQPGPHQIVELRGNNLIVRPQRGKFAEQRPWS